MLKRRLENDYVANGEKAFYSEKNVSRGSNTFSFDKLVDKEVLRMRQ